MSRRESLRNSQTELCKAFFNAKIKYSVCVCVCVCVKGGRGGGVYK